MILVEDILRVQIFIYIHMYIYNAIRSLRWQLLTHTKFWLTPSSGELAAPKTDSGNAKEQESLFSDVADTPDPTEGENRTWKRM